MALRGFVPRLELERAASKLSGLGEPSPSLLGRRQNQEGFDHLLVEALANRRCPVLKWRAPGRGEAGEEWSGIEGNRLVQSSQAEAAGGQLPVAMSLAGGQLVGEIVDVQPDRSSRIELNVVVGHEQQWRRRRAVPEHLAQVTQGLAEPVGRNGIGLLWPEEGGQRFPPMGTIPLDGEVGQERSDQVALEAVEWLAVQSSLNAAEQAERKPRRGAFIQIRVGHCASPSEPRVHAVEPSDRSPVGESIAPERWLAA